MRLDLSGHHQQIIFCTPQVEKLRLSVERAMPERIPEYTLVVVLTTTYLVSYSFTGIEK